MVSQAASTSCSGAEAGLDTNELLDRDVIHELLEGLDPEDVIEVAEISFAEISEQISELQNGLAGGDGVPVKSIAHKIKGCASSIGAQKLADVAAVWEANGNSEDMTAASVQELADLTERSQETLFAILRS